MPQTQGELWYKLPCPATLCAQQRLNHNPKPALRKPNVTPPFNKGKKKCLRAKNAHACRNCRNCCQQASRVLHARHSTDTTNTCQPSALVMKSVVRPWLYHLRSAKPLNPSIHPHCTQQLVSPAHCSLSQAAGNAAQQQPSVCRQHWQQQRPPLLQTVHRAALTTQP
jgi:hypothetical protein